MKRITPKKEWDRRGVSEIVGNLLILAITVTLFSSVMWFVTSMPTPDENVHTDFSATLDIDNSTAIINITHKGGQTLKDFRTNIYLFVDNEPNTLNLSDGNVGEKWETGQTWRYTYNKTNVSAYTPINMMIVDIEANSLVWESILNGQQGDFAPIIRSRGMTKSPAYDGDTLRFYANIIDPDGDLNTSSVKLNASSIGLSSSVIMSDANNDSIFVSPEYTAKAEWNGKHLMISASDFKENSASSRLTISILTQSGGGSVQYGPFYNYSHYLVNGTYPPDASGGESGGKDGNIGTTFYYIRDRSTYAVTNDFDAGDEVMVEVYSDKLANLALENNLWLFHPITGEALSPQSSNNAFSYGGIYGTFHRYVYNFTAPSESYIYPLQMKLKDNRGTVVNIYDSIKVEGANYPTVSTHENQSGTLVETTNFNHTDTVYLRLHTKDVDLNSDTVYISDVEISDYSGRYIIKKVPPPYSDPPSFNGAVSSLFKTSGTSPTPGYEGTSNGVYTLMIKLQDADQGWWLPRKNSYTLRITTISDQGTGSTTGEVYHSISYQFNVTAPLTTTDILSSVGSGSFTWSSSGAYWEDSKIAWYKGGEQWDETVIDDSPNRGPIGLALQDIDGDTDKDVVVGCQDPDYANLVWYENFQPDGRSWSSARPISMPFDALSGQQTDYDSDKGNDNEDATVWKTRWSDRFYDGYYTLYELCGAIGVGDFDGDGDGDVAASFIHVVTYTTASSSDDADYTNTWGMYFNRGVYVFWNDGSWTRTTLYGTMDWVSTDAANKDSNPAAMDLDTADFNRDGYEDIVAVYETGETRVWLSQWGNTVGDITQHQQEAFDSESIRNVPSVPGTDPWDHVQYIPKVQAADVNLDQYPDIVRSSTQNNKVYVFYTQSTTSDEVVNFPTTSYQMNQVNGSASVTGSISTLNLADGDYQNVTEVYLNYSPVNAVPYQKNPSDDTGDSLSDLANEDGVTYDVEDDETMSIASFDLSTTYQGRTVSAASLEMKFSADTAYNGSNQIQWSADGTTWNDLSVTPVAGDNNRTEEIDMLTKGVDTWGDIDTLKVRFINDDGDSPVQFDYLWVNATFVETRWADYVWMIPNELRKHHILTVNLTRGPLSTESFRLWYSPDNSTWFSLTDIASSSQTEYQFNLTYTPNENYYIRLTDLNRATSDTFNDTVSFDYMAIRHYATSVFWDDANKKESSFTAPDYITGIAVGDIGRQMAEYSPDGWPDIVISTASVGGGSDTSTLYLMTQISGGDFDTRPILTSSLSIQCPDDGIYDGKDVELGDTDGDGDLDIVLVIGASFGREPGTGPTLWHYENNQLFSTTNGVWQFEETYLNVLASKGESAINVETGNIDLSILPPFLGVLSVVIAQTFIERFRRRK